MEHTELYRYGFAQNFFGSNQIAYLLTFLSIHNWDSALFSTVALKVIVLPLNKPLIILPQGPTLQAPQMSGLMVLDDKTRC